MDTQLFFFINRLPHTMVTDAVALTLSGIGTAGLIWFLLAVVLFLREEKKDRWFFLPVVSAGVGTWLLVELILKPLIGRLRPDGSGEYSFPSGHATVSFAMAVILTKIEPRWRPWLYGLATLIALSRIFLGKHFPSDVAAGALIGWIIGQTTFSLCYHVLKHSNRKH